MKLEVSSPFDTVAPSIRQFSDGRQSLEDERSGRPHLFLTRDILAHDIVAEDRSITLKFLVSELCFSYASTYSLKHTELKQSKKCAC